MERVGPVWRNPCILFGSAGFVLLRLREPDSSLPERAPRQRPNRDHKQVPAEEGICHICGMAAAATCPQCRLGVCAAHREDLEPALAALFGAWACVECAARSRDELALDRSQWQRKRAGDLAYRTCGECGQTFDQVLPACGVCAKRLCRTHRLRYRKRFRFGRQPDAETGGWYWDYEVRCRAHRLNPLLARLKGWQIDPGAANDDDRAPI